MESKQAATGSISRRKIVQGLSAAGALGLIGSGQASVGNEVSGQKVPWSGTGPSRTETAIAKQVNQTVFIDTHEHIFDEKYRLSGPLSQDDWTALLNGYPSSDMLTAGMPREDHSKFFALGLSPKEKWALLEPYWSAIKNTGYCKAVRLSVRELYGVEDISVDTVEKIEAGYQALQQKGFYRAVLQDVANIESCQVNHILSGTPCAPSSQYPELLRQDIGALNMIMGPGNNDVKNPTGISVKEISDWKRVIDWWFEKYGDTAVAVKSQHAYSRNIDHEEVSWQTASSIFTKVINGQTVSASDRKKLEDHLFWYVVKRAMGYNLPFKLHTGYYAGQNQMPLSRVSKNASAATDICRLRPEQRFIFMHICYPYHEELIAVAKHYTNAYVDMCWSWIINPIAAKDFLKKYLVTAPANKILTFGGDYGMPEQTVGHAIIARDGVKRALCELVDEGYISLPEALDLVDPIMHGNARQIFNM